MLIKKSEAPRPNSCQHRNHHSSNDTRSSPNRRGFRESNDAGGLEDTRAKPGRVGGRSVFLRLPEISETTSSKPQRPAPGYRSAVQDPELQVIGASWGWVG